jgi:hypothetical protein
MRTKHVLIAAAAGLLLAAGAATPASAGQLPDNCTKDKGTVTCTTFDGPGNNQGGVGETTVDETQGNTTNKSPEESQDLDSSTSCKPPKSQGAPCNP